MILFGNAEGLISDTFKAKIPGAKIAPGAMVYAPGLTLSLFADIAETGTFLGAMFRYLIAEEVESRRLCPSFCWGKRLTMARKEITGRQGVCI